MTDVTDALWKRFTAKRDQAARAELLERFRLDAGQRTGDLSKVNYSNYDGFQEAVKVTWDNSVVSYDDLVRIFLRSTDVLDGGGQFCDRGDHYLSAIFVMNDEQKKIAEAGMPLVR